METLLLSPCPLLECCPSLRLLHTLALLSGEARLMDSSFLFSLVTLLHRGILRCVILQHYGGGLVCHLGACWSAAGGANWPIATSCPSLGPFPSRGGGAHRPLTTLCPSSPSLAYPSLSNSLSFPLVGFANVARDFPCCTALCWVHKKEGNCPHCRPGACNWASNTGSGEPLPNGRGSAGGEGVNDFRGGQTVINTFSFKYNIHSPTPRSLYPWVPEVGGHVAIVTHSVSKCLIVFSDISSGVPGGTLASIMCMQ